ncbi:MAG: hypothetical protein AAB281_03530, partial [Actinomycetota bacterium]
MLVIPVWALASIVDVSVVDTTAPTGRVTLSPGGSENITINMSVTGTQGGTATFKVYRDWTLSGGVWVGQNPVQFTVPPRSNSDPPTTFSASGTAAVAAGHATGNYALSIGAFDITNAQTGAKLKAGQSSNYQVTVATPCFPGKPNLTLLYTDASWGSYANYQAHKLSVSWEVRNDSTETAYNVQIIANTNSHGVGRYTALPLILGNIQSGATMAFTIDHSVPVSVGAFVSGLTGTASDCASRTSASRTHMFQ